MLVNWLLLDILRDTVVRISLLSYGAYCGFQAIAQLFSNLIKKLKCVLLSIISIVRKLDFCLCENKGADQLCSNCKADQCLFFRYMDSTISPFPKSEISSF